MIVANPFLNLSEFRTQGNSRYRHGGQVVRLGIGENRGFGWSSPVEVNFSETADGQSARGSTALNRFYVARQIVINEKLWHWIPTPSPTGNWSLESTRARLPDDPDPALVSFNPRPVEVSFLDSPGFLVHHFFNIEPAVQRVCAVQNFRLWIEVNRAYSRGVFQAASDFPWHHCLCLQRAGSTWEVVRSQSLIGRGELQLASPMWR